MSKIFILIIVVIALYRSFNALPCKESRVEECVVSEKAKFRDPQALVEPQMVNDISVSNVDVSQPPNLQPMRRPEGISWTRIAGGWIDIEQLSP
ncbi:MAG TPA: hypothetical protein VFN95_09585 [Flavitalea sp.]|nr:hypothetical protein [Flavitalea sp.]